MNGGDWWRPQGPGGDAEDWMRLLGSLPFAARADGPVGLVHACPVHRRWQDLWSRVRHGYLQREIGETGDEHLGPVEGVRAVLTGHTPSQEPRCDRPRLRPPDDREGRRKGNRDLVFRPLEVFAGSLRYPSRPAKPGATTSPSVAVNAVGRWFAGGARDRPCHGLRRQSRHRSVLLHLPGTWQRGTRYLRIRRPQAGAGQRLRALVVDALDGDGDDRGRNFAVHGEIFTLALVRESVAAPLIRMASPTPGYQEEQRNFATP